MRLINRTPFEAQNALLFNEEGRETLYTLVSASFNIDRYWTLTDKQRPLQAEDLYWGEPGESSVKYAADVHLDKAATDIAVLGNACVTDLKPVKALAVGIGVGKVKKHYVFLVIATGIKVPSRHRTYLSNCPWFMKTHSVDSIISMAN